MKVLLPFIVAPKTGSPTVFSRGILSPLIVDSSILTAPSAIIPSVGTCAPFWTCTRSPTCNWSTEMTSTVPSDLTLRASVGFISNSLVISLLLLPATYSSRKCAPAKIKINRAASLDSPSIMAPSAASVIRICVLGVNFLLTLVFLIVSTIPSIIT